MVLPRAAVAFTEGPTSAVQVHEAPAHCILLKTYLFSYRVASDTFVPRAGSALKGMKDYRGRKNRADA